MAIPKPVSRKELEKLSKWELFKVGMSPYKKILRYLKPYKAMFITAMCFGVLFGLSNGALMFSIQYVAGEVFEGDPALEKEAGEEEGGMSMGPMGGVFGSMKDQLAGSEDAGTEPEPASTGSTGTVAPDEAQAEAQLEMRGDPGPTDWLTLLKVCMIVPLVMLIKNTCGFLNTYLNMKVGIYMLQDLRNEVFSHLMKQGLDFYDQTKSGELIQILYARTKMLQNGAVMIAGTLVKAPFSILGALGMMLYFDWKFTLFMMVLFPVCVIPVVVIGRSVRKAGAQEEQEGGNFAVLLQESFSGIRTVKTFNRQEFEEKRVFGAGQRMTENMLRWKRAMELVGPLVEVVASLGITIAIFYAALTGIGAGTFLALTGGLILLYNPVKTLSKLHITMQKVIVTTEQIFAILELDPKVKDEPEAQPLNFKKGEIEFHRVRFGFRKGIAAVKDINLRFEAGKYYALVGESGAGKSTMFALINRFYDPQKGYITFDGQDIRRVTQGSLREHIGMVTQSNFLFHATIFDNIRYGRLDATEEEVYEAAKKAHAHEFIMQQENGYDTEVGDAGSRLSGGQRQRICIARTFLENAPVLLLDEATSALDAESEEKIKEVLEELTRGRTVIAIAHRFSSLRAADEIIVMHKGEVVEQGPHEELLARDGHYTRLYNLQYKHGGAAGPETAQAQRDDQALQRAEMAEEQVEEFFEGV
jgi:subfamily B ATP-binding cassette protein MsbA